MSATLSLLEKAQNGDEAACGTMLEENSGLIWAVVRRYSGCGVEMEDLYQLGCIGFIKAVKGFDLTYGTQFSTYAVPKIAGEIRRFLRDDGAVKVSRTLREQAARIQQAKRSLEQRLAREPTVFELAAETGLEPEEIAVAETAAAPIESLQQETGEHGFALEQMLGDFDAPERMLEQIALRAAVASLPERERAVIRLRYDRGLTQQRCAALLGISQVQVSRLERRAVDRLRELLRET